MRLQRWMSGLKALIPTALVMLIAACGGGGGGGAGTPTAATPTAPSIVNGPQATTVSLGSPATFSVSATGTAPLSYQWLRDGTPISGATGSSYTTGPTQTTDHYARFAVTVTNASGSTTSAQARLTVQMPLALYAGALGGSGYADGTGTDARLGAPNAALDAAGNAYIFDNGTVRRITPAGVVSRISGAAGQFGTADGDLTSARFQSSSGKTTVAPNGSVYVIDRDRVRRVTTSGNVTTVYVEAVPNRVLNGIAVLDAAGNFAAVTSLNEVLLVSAAGSATLIAGGAQGSVDGNGLAARFNNPTDIAVDSAGNLYVADTSNRTIRKMTAARDVSTIAGAAGQGGAVDGPGPSARFNLPCALGTAPGNVVYVADCGQSTIRRIAADGTVTTVAGRTPRVQESVDGPVATASFLLPTSVAIDAAGSLLVMDKGALRVVSGGAVSTRAGALTPGSERDGDVALARFGAPLSSVLREADGSLLTCTPGGSLRRVSPAGVVTTIALTGAALPECRALAKDASGAIFVASTSQVFRIDAAGLVSAFAGSDSTGAVDAAGAAARFSGIVGIAVDAAGTIFVAESVNKTIRRITASGTVTTFAGSFGASGVADGVGAAARFFTPAALSIDAANTLIVADGGAIRRVSASAAVTTLAGVPDATGFANASGNAARFSDLVSAVAVDASGTIYASDTGNAMVRRISPAGAVSTLAGTLGAPRGVVQGPLPGRLNAPSSLAVEPNGTRVYVEDEHAVVVLTP